MMADGYVDTYSQQTPAFQHSVSPVRRRIRRCASTPALTSCSNDLAQNGLEVYVAFRPFTEFGGALFAGLPAAVKENLLGLGIAHYMTVFRTPDGRYTQFDFGPQGGRDIYVSAGSLDKLMTPDQPRKNGKRSVPGEVRENQVYPFTICPISSVLQAWLLLKCSLCYAAHRSPLSLCVCGAEQLEPWRYTQL